MKTLRLILGDQLSLSISSLKDANKNMDVILMCEVWDEATYVKHHKKKIAFLFSAMRHFSIFLKEKGYTVEYSKLDDPNNSGSFKGEIEKGLKKFGADRIVVTHPGEYRVLKDMQTWEKAFSIKVDIRDDERFLCSINEFSAWEKNKKHLRMEYFYRQMRLKYGILINDSAPAGGKWNYDADNRKPPKEGLKPPEPCIFEPDEITETVILLVEDRFNEHFGDLNPFYFAVTRDDALTVLNRFIEERLAFFGDYQDAMLQGEPWMYHSHISFYLNCGLLLPMECIEAAQTAYYDKKVPLNAVEGFIRQILGWREYVRGIYWTKMPGYASENYLNATRALPALYWDGNTKMNCLHQCVSETKVHAYAHHIQRLMVLGNFVLLIGVNPSLVNEWFLIVYADAYEWVEMPNVTGMILYADGGYLASKPYSAGGSYINKMSDYCKSCFYQVNKKNGPEACPFNYLYWDFLARNRSKLESNQRVRMMYKTYDRMTDDKKEAIQKDSQHFLHHLK